VISVENLTFDRSEADDLPPATFAEQARKDLADYSSVVRYGAMLVLFLLVYLLMIRPIQKRVLATPNPLLTAARIPVLVEPEVGALPQSEANLMEHSLTLKKQLAEFVLAEPEGSTSAVRAWLREETL
jgi:flagellar M-ring protein FliF